MTQDLPDLENLLRTVRAAVDGFAGKLEGESRYHAQVASYLLSIAAREVAAGQAPIAGISNAQLCTEIRSGARDDKWDETLHLVLERVIGKVAVTRPDHLAPTHRSREENVS